MVEEVEDGANNDEEGVVMREVEEVEIEEEGGVVEVET